MLQILAPDPGTVALTGDELTFSLATNSERTVQGSEVSTCNFTLVGA